MLGALAAETLRILNSPLLVEQLARDSFRAGMCMQPNELTCLGGVVPRALEFLAGWECLHALCMHQTLHTPTACISVRCAACENWAHRVRKPTRPPLILLPGEGTLWGHHVAY